MISAHLKIDKRFLKKLQARYGRYDIQGGILEDKAHRSPRSKKKGLGSLQGGPVRKMKPETRGKVSDVSEAVRKVHRVDYLRAPTEKPRARDMVTFRRAMLELISGKAASYSKVEAALRAVLRNPILKAKYGRNSSAAARTKGFNRKLIDTGQFFKAILTKVRVRRVQK